MRAHAVGLIGVEKRVAVSMLLRYHLYRLSHALRHVSTICTSK